MTGPHAKTVRLAAIMREFYLLERPLRRFADLAGVPYDSACRLARLNGLRFRKAWGHRHAAGIQNVARAETMAALYRDGFTLKQIGDQYGLTRERVRQILAKHKRMNATNGGQHIRAQRRAGKRRAAKDAKAMRDWGCTYEQWLALVALGKEMRAAGKGKYQTPTAAYRNQKNNAGQRGIGFDLTLWQWWTIWQQSGHWDQRGRGQGYCMCRKGDVGPYAVDNVFIALAAENSREGSMYKRKDPTLPIGVTRTASGKFHAKRHLHGKPLNLGVHATPELAYAAYLMADQPQQRAA
jgi:hypothetical protein